MFKLFRARADLRTLDKLAQNVRDVHDLKMFGTAGHDEARRVSQTMGAMSAKIVTLESEVRQLRARADKRSYDARPAQQAAAFDAPPQPVSAPADSNAATWPWPVPIGVGGYASRDMYPPSNEPAPFRAGGAVEAFAGGGAAGSWDGDAGRNSSPTRSAALDNDIAAILGGVPLPEFKETTGIEGLVGIERLSEPGSTWDTYRASESDSGSSDSSPPSDSSSSSSDSGSSDSGSDD